MTQDFAKTRQVAGIDEVLRLTQAGRLNQATAHIQRLLGNGTSAIKVAEDDVIEGDFTQVSPSSERSAASKSPRSSLAETLRKIAAGGMPSNNIRNTPVQPLPAGASFTTHTYSGPQGSRDYMLYIPASAASETTPLPLIVMLHGCTQTPADFAIGTGMNAVAETERIIVAYPMQSAAANMSKCWNWFRPTDQVRDGGEPAILASITREILDIENADRTRVYVAGLSAGGAAAAVIAQAYPDLFAAVGVHSGLPVGAANDVPSALAAMRNGVAGAHLNHAVPTIVFHGTADHTVDVKNGRAVMDQALKGFVGNQIVTTGKSSGGRRYQRCRQSVPDGRSSCEFWLIEGGPHAWAGGNTAGSYTDPSGPDASTEMVRFFRDHALVE